MTLTPVKSLYCATKLTLASNKILNFSSGKVLVDWKGVARASSLRALGTWTQLFSDP